MLCLLHGATFLALEDRRRRAERARGLAAKLVWPAVVLVVVYAVWTVSISDGGVWRHRRRGRTGASPSLAAALLIRSGHEGRSFAATAVAIGGTVAALFANLYPDVMVSSTERRQQPHRRRHRVERLRPEGHDRRRPRHDAARPALPGLVLLGVPRPGQRASHAACRL